MEPAVAPMIGSALGAAAVVLAACGLFLIFLDINRGDDEPGKMRRRLARTWLALAGRPLADAPALAVRAMVAAADRFVAYWFEQSERNVAASGAFTLIVLVAIPLASLVNWLRGGSGFLIAFIMLSVLRFVALAVLSELRRGERYAAILAPALFAAVFLFVPGYVLVSLTDRTLNMPIGHATLVSILVAPLLYLVCHSLVLIGAAAWGMPVASIAATAPRRAATLFAAALPPAYLAVFVCLLVGHLAFPDENVPSTWRALLIALGAAAVSAAATVQLARGDGPLAGLSLASALAIAIAAVVSFLASPWLAAVAVAAPLMLWAAAAFALVARATLALGGPLFGAAVAAERPYMIGGVMALIVATGTGWASAIL